MPYRDDEEALRARAEAAERERDGLEEALARSRAGLASVAAWMAGLPSEADIPWRSLHGGEPIEVAFVNPGPQTVSLVFVGYDGREHIETTLISGGTHRAPTHTGHLWRFRRDEAVVWQGYARSGEPRLGPRSAPDGERDDVDGI